MNLPIVLWLKIDSMPNDGINERSKWTSSCDITISAAMSVTDLSQKYGLSSEQVKQLQTVFNDFNKDHDGSISEVEISGAMTSLGQTVKKMIGQLIKASDGDGDGRINFEEFLTVLAPWIKVHNWDG